MPSISCDHSSWTAGSGLRDARVGGRDKADRHLDGVNVIAPAFLIRFEMDTVLFVVFDACDEGGNKVEDLMESGS